MIEKMFITDSSNAREVYNEMVTHRKEESAVSFMKVLRIREVQVMILAGGLKVIADSIDFYCIGQTSKFDIKGGNNYLFYFYGSLAALLAGGILHDKLL